MGVFLNGIVKEDIESVIRRTDFSAFNGKRVLIAGANGHIASYLALTLAEAAAKGIADIEITVLSRSHGRLLETYGPYVDKKQVRILAQDVVNPLPENEKFDYVFHFAGNASPHFIAEDPVGILRANIDGTFNMAELCLREKDSRLIFASTREVYGNNTAEDSLTESSFGSLDPLDPRSCYPESKRAAESIIEAYHKQHGMRYTIARIAHVYGPGMKLAGDGRVMSDFINNALNGEAIRLNSDGTALRAFCYVTDAVAALLKIAVIPERAAVFNLSNETEEISIGELARMIGRLAGGLEVSMRRPDPATAGLYCAYKRKGLDCSRLSMLGWQPEVSLGEGLGRTIKGSHETGIR